MNLLKSEDLRIKPGHGRLSRYLPARGRRAPLTHRPAAARAPRTTPGCTCGHGSAPPANSDRQPLGRARTYAGGGPWRRIAPSCRPMAGRRPRMTRAHDRHITLPQ